MRDPIDKPVILVVDDDVELTEMLGEYLEGFTVATAHDGNTGLKKALGEVYSLVVLDVMLPRMNGFEVLRRLRATSQVPVLMLTARGDSVDRIVGLQGGADDYLPKPFNPEELLARMNAILRRVSPLSSGPEVLTIGDVSLDGGARTVRRGGAPVEMTAAEFDLLRVLMRSAGRAVDRESLLHEVLGRHFSSSYRSIDNHISNLRRKLGPALDGRERIRAIRNTGYTYTIPEAATGPESTHPEPGSDVK
ncbi:MAG: response regulator transcription factor [Bryobacterales bacterium]|nr:response regulator transcription factor [Bryobacterales bacterium]MBV9400726.1 response regulator transcription factor [Bryobacterales bacterium]